MEEITTINPGDISVSELHHYLLAAVAPRPIAFASTVDINGIVNLSPFSFFNVFSSNPPIMIFSPARSGRDGSLKHTHQNILEVPEVVINIVNYPMVQQMSLASTSYEKGVNEFEKAGFSELASDLVKPPRVKESPVTFECTVREVMPLGDDGGAGNLVICEVVRFHLHKRFLIDGRLDTLSLDLIGRMGDSWYCHANKNALFEVEKPGSKPGIGVDQLPSHVRHSEVLTGNQIGKLGGLHQLPSESDVSAMMKQVIKEMKNDKITLHKYAQALIEQGDPRGALTALLTLDLEN